MTHRFITKSSFMQGYDCPRRLSYAVQNTFASLSQGDDFLRMLAEGGFQFEMLVRHAWKGETLGGFTKDAAAAHAKTMTALRACLKNGKGVLHEAVFVSGNLFARVDMLRINGNTIELCEIKAKSFDGPTDPASAKTVLPCTGEPADIKTSMLTKATKKNLSQVRSVWRDYIADIGFQSIVVERALAAENLAGTSVSSRLMVSNKRQVACAHDWFGNVLAIIDPLQVSEERGRPQLQFVKEPPSGFRSALIAEVDVQAAINLLRNVDAQSGAQRWRGKTLDFILDDASKLIEAEETVDPATERAWKCRSCVYNTSAKGEKQCGFDLCWGKGATSARNLFQLYYGKTYTPRDLGTGSEVNEEDEWIEHVISKEGTNAALKIADLEPELEGTGSSANSPRLLRRTRQILAAQQNATQFSEDFADIVKRRLMPKSGTGILRFMDFETTSACLPYNIGMRPYEVVAFQFSVHSLVVKNREFDLSKIRHSEGLFVGSSKDTDLHQRDVEFASALRVALTEPFDGVNDEVSSVFHWASHERTIMRAVSARLAARGGQEELVRWMDATCQKEDNDPPGRLVDLLKVAEANVFHPLQHGRFSIKKFLPALCSEAGAMDVVRALGFTSNVQPNEDGCVDPYKGLDALAEVLGDSATGLVREGEDGDDDASEGDGIRTGTAAMRAYQQLRFAECVQWKDASKQPIDNGAVEQALLRYCKLDTAAMVVVWWWLWNQGRQRD